MLSHNIYDRSGTKVPEKMSLKNPKNEGKSTCQNTK